MSNPQERQPWIYSFPSDGAFILAPAFVATLVVLLFPSAFDAANEMPPWIWLVLIVGIDVSHVYSTLYRTYFDPEEFQKYKQPLIWIPAIGLAIGIGLYLVSSMAFWTALAYLAVYHFVRQQYGFFRIYARKEKPAFSWERHLDGATIYATTVYPLLYWHCHLPRNFNWFMPGDFIQIPWEVVSTIGAWIYLLLLILYVINESRNIVRNRFFNIPKNLILAGTAVSWYVGIVLYNGDFAFTATNVVAHGIPYMALIWMYGRKKAEKKQNSGQGTPYRLSKLFRLETLPVFLGIIFILGFLEEGMWNALVWRDHPTLFTWFESLPTLPTGTLAVAVPLLALPQVTHYLIDGFIWRMRGKDPDIQEGLLKRT